MLRDPPHPPLPPPGLSLRAATAAAGPGTALAVAAVASRCWHSKPGMTVPRVDQPGKQATATAEAPGAVALPSVVTQPKPSGPLQPQPGTPLPPGPLLVPQQTTPAPLGVLQGRSSSGPPPAQLYLRPPVVKLLIPAR